MNGKKVTISDYEIDSTDIYNKRIVYTTYKGKIKSKYLDDVFSIVDENKKETILYRENDVIGEILTQKQMKSFVLGLHDMQHTRISPLVTIGGFVSGLSVAFIPMPQIYMFYLPVGVLVPVAYVSVIGTTPPNDIKLKERLPDKANDEYYILGYQNGIKKKRIRNSIIGVGVGLLTGFIITTTVN
jgi:hypothetical protein